MKHIYLLAIALIFGINAKAQVFEYANPMGYMASGTTAYDESYCTDIALCSDNSIIQVGFFMDTVDLDPGTGVQLGISPFYWSSFIQKLDSAGNLIWAKVSEIDNINFVEVDSLDNIYITGNLGLTATDVDPDPVGTFILTDPTGEGKSLVSMKLDASGNFIWANLISHGGTGGTAAMPFDAKLDRAGNFYVIGNYSGTIDLDPGVGVLSTTCTSTTSNYLIKLDPLGNLAWGFADPSGDWAVRAIGLDSSQNVYLAGMLQGTFDFDFGPGTHVISSVSGMRAFIHKLDINGNFVWVKSFGDSTVEAADVMVNSINELYIVGRYEGTIDIDPGAGTYMLPAAAVPGMRNCYIAKLNPAGDFLWAKNYGEGYHNIGSPLKIEMDKHQNLYTAAYLNNTIDLDPGLTIDTTVVSAGSFIQKLDSSGNYISGVSYGGYVSNFAVDKINAIYTNGHFQNTTDFDPDPTVTYLLSTIGTGSEGYLMKLYQGPCNNLSLKIDSASNATCSVNGYIQTHAQGGTLPYSYEWQTSPPVTDSVITIIDSAGIYSIKVTDSSGCVAQRWIYLSAPSGVTSFDAKIGLTASNVRIGFPATVDLIGTNSGCLPAAGQIKFRFSDTLLVDIDSIIPAPDFMSGDTLVWNYTGLIYGGVVDPKIYFHPSDSASFGDLLCHEAWITPLLGDVDSSNNLTMTCRTIVNGYDPNIKSVYPVGECPEHYVLKDQKMTYTVQFQNTGNAPAFDIYILDTLDADLDLNSLEIMHTSHAMYTEVLPGNILKFVFDNINLPDSTNNEPASHGHVIYTVDQQPALATGTMLINTAYIYFDSNPAIVTNTVFNTVVDEIPACVLSVNETPQEQNNLVVYPNPATQTITVISKGNLGEAITIYDVYGRLIKQLYTSSHITTIDINEFSDGVYVIHCSNQTSKFIKR